MPILIVVNDPRDWPLEVEGVELVAARTYLADSRYAEMRAARVFNLCRSYRYQSIGYYVSLLAAARGHKPLPDVTTIQDFKLQTIIHIASEDLDGYIQRSLSPIKSKEFTLSIYFGHNVAKRHEVLSQQLFKLFQAPFFQAHFVVNACNHKWRLQNIVPIAASEIPLDHRTFVVSMAQNYFKGRQRTARRRISYRYDLAILRNPEEPEPPSNERAIGRFVKAAESLGLATEIIDKEDYGRLAEFDALFIRETTSVNHHTYRFARRGMAEGLVVIDDPESILKCTNKVFLAEVLQKNKIPTPKTIIVHRDNVPLIEGELGLPCILKKPDSSFSQGVVKAETSAELEKKVARLLERSDLIIGQEFMPTPFDWRVGIFDRQPLFVCKYYMAKRHWQIIKRNIAGVKTDDGVSETIPVEHAPPGLIKAALRAANLIGDGLYGVDIKQAGSHFFIIEVNDNPNIDAGIEDLALKDELYLRIMRVFVRRIEQGKQIGGWA